MVAVLADEPFVQQLLTLTAVLLGAAALSHRAVGQRTAQRYRIAATRRGALPVALEEGLAALADAENERAIKRKPVLLLSSKAMSDDDFFGLYQVIDTKRDESSPHARADLGVRSDRLPQPDGDCLATRSGSPSFCPVPVRNMRKIPTPPTEFDRNHARRVAQPVSGEYSDGGQLSRRGTQGAA